ncbi:MAG: enolase C-terminal domain-like protein [Balneolaceae bacterium]|nr:enolase C-terminal domain-like protein [Balneolaceae bacterium]
MKRRDFVYFLTVGAGGVATACNPARSPSESGERAQDEELQNHTIDSVEFSSVQLNYPRQVGRNSRLGIHGFGPEVDVGILRTDQGAMGWGMLQGGEDQWKQTAEYVQGKQVSDLIDPSIGLTDEQAEVFDVVLHDLAGVILEKPVYELLGRSTPFITNCYSGMIYFDDMDPEEDPAGIDKILEECQYDYDLGYRQFKLKIGRGNKWMPHDEGMKRDIEVTKLVAEHFPDCDILVDANNGYTLEDTITYLEGIEGIDLFWFEEPFHENYKDYLELRKWLLDNGREIFLSDGEARPDQELLMDLYEKRILDFHLTDIVSHGFTAWRKLMPQLIEMGISASPHAWGALLKTYYIAHLAGGLGNMPTIEGVTCDSEDVNFGAYKLEEGILTPSPDPGFGMELLV